MLPITHLIGHIPRSALDERQNWSTVCVWTNTHTRERVASIGCALDFDGPERNPRLQLFYTVSSGEERKSISEWVNLVSTPCNYGGVRWWFQCPGCFRRVGKLYHPRGYGARYFQCRHCYDLTYTSAQEAHQFDRTAGIGTWARRLDQITRAEVVRSKWERARRGSKRERYLFRRMIKLMDIDLRDLVALGHSAQRLKTGKRR